MRDQLRRLERLEREVRALGQTEPEDRAVSFARKWVADHGVDPSLFDRWLRNGWLEEVDLRTYTVLTDAVYEAWDALGVHLPAWICPGLFCVEVLEIVDAHVMSGCECDDDDFCGRSCALAGRWPGRPTDALRRLIRSRQ